MIGSCPVSPLASGFTGPGGQREDKNQSTPTPHGYRVAQTGSPHHDTRGPKISATAAAWLSPPVAGVCHALHKSVLYVLSCLSLLLRGHRPRHHAKSYDLSGPHIGPDGAWPPPARAWPGRPACRDRHPAMGGLRRAVADSCSCATAGPAKPKPAATSCPCGPNWRAAPAWARHESAAGTPGSTELLPGQD